MKVTKSRSGAASKADAKWVLLFFCCRSLFCLVLVDLWWWCYWCLWSMWWVLGWGWRREGSSRRRRGRTRTNRRGRPAPFLCLCAVWFCEVVWLFVFFFFFCSSICWSDLVFVAFLWREEFRVEFKEKNPHNNAVSAVWLLAFWSVWRLFFVCRCCEMLRYRDRCLWMLFINFDSI